MSIQLILLVSEPENGFRNKNGRYISHLPHVFLCKLYCLVVLVVFVLHIIYFRTIDCPTVIHLGLHEVGLTSKSAEIHSRLVTMTPLGFAVVHAYLSHSILGEFGDRRKQFNIACSRVPSST